MNSRWQAWSVVESLSIASSETTTPSFNSSLHRVTPIADSIELIVPVWLIIHSWFAFGFILLVFALSHVEQLLHLKAQAIGLHDSLPIRHPWATGLRAFLAYDRTSQLPSKPAATLTNSLSPYAARTLALVCSTVWFKIFRCDFSSGTLLLVVGKSCSWRFSTNSGRFRLLICVSERSGPASLSTGDCPSFFFASSCSNAKLSEVTCAELSLHLFRSSSLLLDTFFCSPSYCELLNSFGIESRYTAVQSDHWNILASEGLSNALRKELEWIEVECGKSKQ